MIGSIASFFRSGHTRSRKIKKHIFLTLCFRLPAVLIDFLVIRLTLDYLEPVKYGIWVTLVSISSWFSFSDLGLGSGLRNRLAESLASHNTQQARAYISTTYAMVGLLIAVMFVLFWGVNLFLPWHLILNTPPEMEGELRRLALWMIFFFGLFYVTSLIKTVFIAQQTPSIATGIELATSLVSLAIVWVLLKTMTGSLFLLGFWRALAMALVPLAAGLIYFQFYCPELGPSLKYAAFKQAKDLMHLGGQFFWIQLCAVFIISTDIIIIAQLLGPEKVTSYAIVYKYFNVFTMGFAMLVSPLWSAFTEAYAMKDFVWIRRIIAKSVRLMIPSLAIIFCMGLASRMIIERVWLGRTIDIPGTLIVFMGFYVLLQAWNRIYSWFLNGIGHFKVQRVTLTLGALMNIPLSIIFARDLSLGVSGVILGTIASLMLFGVCAPVIANRILHQEAG